MRGRELLVQLLIDEGVDRVFGNPGTTELPLVEELSGCNRVQYVLALQEASAVGMADGYAQVTGRPAFVNLHSSAGLGNAIGNLTNAMANGSPMVVTAGQQDRRHLVTDPLLAGDLVGIARPVAKWAEEVHRLQDLGTLLRRAFADAMDWPRAPVFLSLPMDVLDEEAAGLSPPPRSTIDRRSVPPSLSSAADLLCADVPGGVVLVVGDEVAASGGVDSAVRLAETLGAQVFATPLHASAVFPPGHALFRGALPPSAAATRGLLAGFKTVVLLGGRGFMSYPFTEGSPLPDGAQLVHLSPEAEQLGRVHPTRLGLVGDPRATIEALTPLVAAKVDPVAVAAEVRRLAEAHEHRTQGLEEKARARWGAVPVHPMAAVHAALRALPAETPVVDEVVTSGPYVRGFHRYTRPHRYFSSRGGGLGWAIPAAVGVSMGLGATPTLCVVGDGSALYSPQALWTAARESLPVVVVVLDNSQYLILKQALQTGYEHGLDDRPPGLHLDRPPVDFCALARSFGVPGVDVATASELADAVGEAVTRDGPTLVHVTVGA
jgi:benzoylformate decarboxylase